MVNFVGTRTTNRYCESGQQFDRDHNGVLGITAEEVLNQRLTPWLAALTPDTVLLLLGGNDLDGGNIPAVMTRLGMIVDRIRIDNPDVVIHAGMYGYVGVRVPDATVDDAANQLQTLIATKSTVQSPIHFVDHRVGWDKSIHLFPIDRFHPNNAGMQKMAANWLASIQTHQAGATPSTVQYQPDQMIGRRANQQSGANRFSNFGNNQRLRLVSRNGRKLTFYFSIENDGNQNDVIGLRSTRGNRFFRVRILDRKTGSKNVTAKAIRGRYEIDTDPGETIQYRLIVKPKGAATRSRKVRTFVLRAGSKADANKRDVTQARAETRRGR